MVISMNIPPFFMEEREKICAKTCYIFKKRLILQQEL